VKEDEKGFMFTADSGRTERCWELAKKDAGVGVILADVSFPNRMESIAAASGHMTPDLLRDRLRTFALQDRTIYVTHMKPFFCEEIIAELTSMQEKNIRFLEQGSTLTL
jgi:hypothetical protein